MFYMGGRMKRKLILIAALAAAVVLAIVIITVFTPKKFISEGDSIDGLRVTYRGAACEAYEESIVNILSKYDAVTSLKNYAPYEMAKVEFEIDFTNESSGRPMHIVLGEFNMWYDFGDSAAHDILNAQRLKDELKEALGLS
jgi:hypothetical protein